MLRFVTLRAKKISSTVSNLRGLGGATRSAGFFVYGPFARSCATAVTAWSAFSLGRRSAVGSLSPVALLLGFPLGLLAGLLATRWWADYSGLVLNPALWQSSPEPSALFPLELPPAALLGLPLLLLLHSGLGGLARELGELLEDLGWRRWDTAQRRALRRRSRPSAGVLAFQKALDSQPFETALRQPLPRLLPPLLLLSLLALWLWLVAFVHSPGLVSCLLVFGSSFWSCWRLAKPGVPTSPEESALPHLLALWLLQLHCYHLLQLERPLGHPTAPLSHRGQRRLEGASGAAAPAEGEQRPRLAAWTWLQLAGVMGLLVVIPVGLLLLLPGDGDSPPAEQRPEVTPEESPAAEVTPRRVRRMRRVVPVRPRDEEGNVITHREVAPSGPVPAAASATPAAANPAAATTPAAPTATAAAATPPPFPPAAATSRDSVEVPSSVTMTVPEHTYGPIRAFRAFSGPVESSVDPMDPSGKVTELRASTLRLAQRLVAQGEPAELEEKGMAAVEPPAAEPFPAIPDTIWDADGLSSAEAMLGRLDRVREGIAGQMERIVALSKGGCSVKELTPQLSNLRNRRAALLRYIEQLYPHLDKQSRVNLDVRYGVKVLRTKLEPSNWDQFVQLAEGFAKVQRIPLMGRQLQEALLVQSSLRLVSAPVVATLEAQETTLRRSEALLEAFAIDLIRQNNDPRETLQQLQQLQQVQQQLREFEAARPKLQALVLQDSLQQQRFASMRTLEPLEQLLQGNLHPEQQLQRRRELLETLQGLLRQQERLRPLLPQFAALDPQEHILRVAQFEALDRRLLWMLEQLVPEPDGFDPAAELRELTLQRRARYPQLPAAAAAAAEAAEAAAEPAAAAEPSRAYLLQLREGEDLPPAIRRSHGGLLSLIPGRYPGFRGLWEPTPTAEVVAAAEAAEIRARGSRVAAEAAARAIARAADRADAEAKGDL